MRKSADQIALLQNAKTEHDAARYGFLRLSSIFTAIERLANGADPAIANLASAGATFANELANESRSASDQYAHLIDKESHRHG